MSEAFTRMRVEAIAGRLTDGAWIELGADKDADPCDRKQWAKANPSYPLRTPAQSILRLQRKLTPEDFLREGMGVWDENDHELVIPGWSDRADPGVAPVIFAVGAAVGWGGAYSSIAVAGMSGDQLIVGAVDRRAGSDWLAAEVARIQGKHSCYVVVDEVGPTASLIPDMKKFGVNVTTLNTSAVANACAALKERVRAGTITHPGHPDLDKAVAVATTRDVGERGPVWARKKSTGDISMLEAATNAAWIAATTNHPTVW
jgi:hypothetical protein